MMPSDALKDRVVLVTGATGGLGRVAAKTCAAHGAAVILLGKTIPKLEALYDEIVAHRPAVTPAIYPLDLAGARERDYADLAQIIEKKYGVLQGLVHSAAQLGVLGPIQDLDAVSWHYLLNVNLNAPYMLTRALLPVLQKAEDASIIFTSDSVARTGRAYWGAYGVAKIALEGFAHILAEELESAGKIRVNILIPGPVASPLRKRAYPGEDVERLPAPKSLEKLYVYLLSAASRERTGEVFKADSSAANESNR